MNMIEKVARAIMIAGGGCEVVDWEAEAVDNPNVDRALKQARAAIEALREPTEEMCRDGARSMRGSDSMIHSSNLDALLVWRAMIDATMEYADESE